MQRKVYLDFQDGQGFREVSSLVKYDTLNVTLRAFSENFHYAQNEASFDVLYDPIIYPLLRYASKDIIVRIIDVCDVTTFLALESSGRLLMEDGFYLLTEVGGYYPFFYGRITPNKTRTYDGILENTVFSVQAEDDTKLLDVPIGDIVYSNYTIMNPSFPSTSIVHQLAYLAGFTLSQISPDVTISTSFTKFAPNDPSDSILEVMSALLFEYGYAVNFGADGVLTPLRWINTDAVGYNFTESNMVRQVQVTESTKTFYGAEVIYYEIGTLTNALLYRDSNCPYSATGGFSGYPIPAGSSYPPTTNVVDPATGADTLVYQDYTDDAVKYWTNAAIVQGLDYNYKAFSSDFSGILATANHVLDTAYDAGITVTSGFFNKRALVKYENPTGGFLNLYFNNIRGDIWYRTTERSSTVLNTTVSGNKIDRYSSSFLYSKTDADNLVKHLAAIYDVGNLFYTVTFDPASTHEKGISVGQVVNITMGDGTDQDCIIAESQWDEASQQYTYKLRAYASDIGSIDLTSQNVSVAPMPVGAYTATVESVPETVVAYSPHYLGKYDHANPSSYNNGDWWLVYDTDDSPIQRGVWYSANGTPTRISDDVSGNARYISTAMTDILWAVNQGTYGILSNYATVTYIENLVASTAFIAELAAATIISDNITGSGSYVLAADRSKPRVEFDLHNSVLTMRDDTIKSNSVYRKVVVGKANGLRAYQYDSSGGSETIVHDLPDVNIVTGFRDMGHLYGVNESSEFAGPSISITDAATSYSSTSAVSNVNVSSYLPSGIGNVKAVMATVDILMFAAASKVAVGSRFQGYSYASNTYNGSQNKLLKSNAHKVQSASQIFEMTDYSPCVIPVNYNGSTPYISVFTGIYFSGMAGVSANYYCETYFRIIGFYA